MPGQVVQITIDITDGNAAETVQRVVAQLNAIGPAGEAGGAAAAAGLDQIGEHALTNLDNVRLLRDDLGIHIPRAMEKAISQSAMLSSAMGAVGGGFLALGAVEILTHMGEQVYDLYEKWFDVNAVTDEYERKLEEAAQKQFLNPENVQMAIDNLRQVNAQLDLLNEKKEKSDATWGGFLSAGDRYTPDDERKRVGLLDQQRQLDDNATKYSNQSLENGIARMQKFVEATEIGYQKIADLKDLADKKTLLAFSEGKFGDPHDNFAASYDRYKDAITDNHTDSDADKIALKRQESEEIISLQNAATNAELSGVELLEAKREQAIATFEQKYGISMKAIADIDRDYLAQETALWDRQEKEGDKARQTRLEQEDEALKKSLDEQAENQDRVNSLMASSAAYELQGYAKLDAEKQNRMTELAKADDKLYSNMASALDAFSAQTIQVEADSDRERQQLHQRTMEQIIREEQETARLLLPDWQQAQQAIVDQETDKVKQINAAEDQQLAHFANNAAVMKMIQQEADAQMVAAHQLANAQMQKSEDETRDKIASGLQSLFSHPEKFFEETAMKTGFQLMANEMLSVFQSSGSTGGILQYLFGMGPQMNTSTNPLNAMESVLGLSGHHSGGVSGLTNPAVMQFQQGSTTLLTGSQALLQAAAMVAQLGTGGGSGMGLMGMGGGGFGMLGSTTVGGAGVNIPTGDAASAMPAYSTGSGMVGSSPMPETVGNPMAGAIDANGNFTAAAQSPGSLGTYAGIAGGALMGATSIYSAYQNSNPIAGAAGGAAGGMEVGSSIGMLAGGPAGALLGGAIGAIAGGIGGLFAGIFGDQGKGQAEGLDVDTVQPELLKDMQDYQTGRSGYSAIAADLNNLLRSSQNSTSTWGSGARNYFNSNIQPEIDAAITSLQKQEIGGRSAVTLSAGQFHSGGLIGDFGDLATSDTEGFIHAMRNEMVMNPSATAAHAPILQAMNSGINFGYSSAVQPRMPANSGGGGGTVVIQALDSKSFVQWSKAGGGRALVSSLNQAQTQYSGKGR